MFNEGKLKKVKDKTNATPGNGKVADQLNPFQSKQNTANTYEDLRKQGKSVPKSHYIAKRIPAHKRKALGLPMKSERGRRGSRGGGRMRGGGSELLLSHPIEELLVKVDQIRINSNLNEDKAVEREVS